MKIREEEFFGTDAETLAKELLGKIIVCKTEVGKQRFIIAETECYQGVEDTACHASGRRAKSAAAMWGRGGILYIYLIYGMHYMLNIVSGREGNPMAVLIRGIIDITNYNLQSNRNENYNNKESKKGTKDKINVEIKVETNKQANEQVNYQTNEQADEQANGEINEGINKEREITQQKQNSGKEIEKLRKLCIKGPGRVTKACKICKEYNYEDILISERIWLEDEGITPNYTTSKRVGIDYAAEIDREKQWRYIAYDSIIEQIKS